VIKVTSAGALSTLATGLTALSGIAVDGAGVVYATYNGTNILKIAQNGTQTSCSRRMIVSPLSMGRVSTVFSVRKPVPG